MIAPVHTAEYSAITFGSPPSGATIGGIARIAGAWKARATPKAKAMTNSGITDVGLLRRRASARPEVTTSTPTVIEGDRLAVEAVGHRPGDEHEQRRSGGTRRDRSSRGRTRGR